MRVRLHTTDAMKAVLELIRRQAPFTACYSRDGAYILDIPCGEGHEAAIQHALRPAPPELDEDRVVEMRR